MALGLAVNNMGKLAQQYQRRATGASSGKGCYVGPVQFDGYRGGKAVRTS